MEKQNLPSFTEEKGKPGKSYFSIARAPRKLILKKKEFCETAKSLRLQIKLHFMICFLISARKH